jgi:archaellum component FlaC
MIQAAGVSLPAPDRIEEMRRMSSTLARLLINRVKVETIDLVKMLQNATKEGFDGLEDEIKHLIKRVDDLQDKITVLESAGNQKSEKFVGTKLRDLDEERP